MKKISTIAASATALALLAAGLLATPAQAAAPGCYDSNPLMNHCTKALADVLAADGNTFDTTWGDYDIVDRAVRKVLAEKPMSPVIALTMGEVPLTAFLPTDRAFRRLVNSVTGTKPASERATWRQVKAIAGDTDTLESILLYHVTLGTVTSDKVTNGLVVNTVLMGSSFKVVVSGGDILLRDADPNASNPKVIAVDINRWNRQIAHGIDRVLRPLDLKPLA